MEEEGSTVEDTEVGKGRRVWGDLVNAVGTDQKSLGSREKAPEVKRTGHKSAPVSPPTMLQTLESMIPTCVQAFPHGALGLGPVPHGLSSSLPFSSRT